MSLSVDSSSLQSDNVEKILAKIQEDLQYLRVAATCVGDGELDPQSLDIILARTERGVQTVAERVVHSNNSQVVTLPAVTGGKRRGSGNGRGQQQAKTMEDLVSGAQQRNQIKQARASKHSKPPPSGLSPGQQAQVDHMSQLVSKPTHPLTRDMLATHYQLSSFHGNNTGNIKEVKSVPGQLQVGSTIKPLTTLSRANRRDAQLTPPSISQDDARKGLLSLLERGLIPPAADIVLSPPPVQPRTLPLYSSTEQHQRAKIAEGTFTNLTGVKLDLTGIVEESPSKAIVVPAAGKSSTQSMSKNSTTVSVKTLEAPSIVVQRPQAPPTSAVGHTQKETSTSYKVIVQNGSIVNGIMEFTSFKKTFRHRWTSVQAILHSAEELCRNYSIPLAIMDGDKVSSLASEFELGLRPSKRDILECLTNADEVENLLIIPGRRYKGDRGLHAAAAKIQATYRMSVKRRQYLDYRRKKWAAGILCMSWLMFMKLYHVREQLKEARAKQLSNHHTRAGRLRRRWQDIQSSKRTIVHIPSQGHPEAVRSKIDRFSVKQNMQMSRLFDVRDPNVEVIYISPVSMDKEVVDYYHKMLGMGPAGDEGKERIHIITPEAVHHFPARSMALSTLLLYSPKSLARVRNLVAGREAYIVSGVVNRDDITVADKLGLPLLGSEPEITQLYSTKSGSKKIFSNAGLAMPYSMGDIYSEEQLIERLASLVTSYPLVPRWLFKLPEHVRGKGFAYCDVSKHLHCHQWLLRESERYGKKWIKKWAQEHALKRITAELPSILSSHARPVDRDLFPAWKDFLEQFLHQGGLIEGVPPSDSVTSLSVDMLIEPTGNIHILTAQDQICARPYEVWGVSLPQSSIDPAHLAEKAMMVGVACKARGIIGHLSVDFVTFIDPKELTQVLWAVDLDIGYSDHLALYQMLTYVSGVEMKPDSGRLELEGGESRYAVLAPHLMHTNLCLLYYSIFFQMCKAHFIGFDPKERLGTLFALVDAQHKEHLGMICLEESLSKAVSKCSSNLSTIHQEISTPHMQGTSNFQAASKELDLISQLVDTNEDNGSEEAKQSS